jgi:S1-C subfamily serine protease
MSERGWRLDHVVRWTDPPPSAADRDAAALVAGDGKLPEGFVPAGRAAPGEIPPLPVLGGTVVLEIVGGEPRARVTAAPEGSRARKIGLREGDLILEVGGKGVGPRNLSALDESPPAGGQHTLRVRRTHGGIEQVAIDSWVGSPSR